MQRHAALFVNFARLQPPHTGPQLPNPEGTIAQNVNSANPPMGKRHNPTAQSAPSARLDTLHTLHTLQTLHTFYHRPLLLRRKPRIQRLARHRFPPDIALSLVHFGFLSVEPNGQIPSVETATSENLLCCNFEVQYALFTAGDAEVRRGKPGNCCWKIQWDFLKCRPRTHGISRISLSPRSPASPSEAGGESKFFGLIRQGFFVAQASRL
jgi:hypothetical protein